MVNSIDFLYRNRKQKFFCQVECLLSKEFFSNTQLIMDINLEILYLDTEFQNELILLGDVEHDFVEDLERGLFNFGNYLPSLEDLQDLDDNKY